MITKIKLNSFSEVQALVDSACQLYGDAYIHSAQQGECAMIDMKSYSDVLKLDFDKPVLLVSENAWIHRQAKRFAVQS